MSKASLRTKPTAVTACIYVEKRTVSWRQAVATPLRKCGSSNCWVGEWGGLLVRLERAVPLQAAQPDLDLLGLHLGYHDYLQLMRDCRPFAGVTSPGWELVSATAAERRSGIM